MLLNHVNSMVHWPGEHEFPHKRSAFPLQRCDVEWLMGLDDGADFALWRNSLDHCTPVPISAVQAEDRVHRGEAELFELGREVLAMIDRVAGSVFLRPLHGLCA